MTAPRPPRPWLRILLSGSLTEMLAAVILISPAGPMVRTPVFLPRRASRASITAKFPWPISSVLFLNGDAVLVDMEAVPLVFLGEPFDDQRLDAEAGQHLGGGAAGVALLDGAGQRALGAGRQPPGVGRRRAGQQPGGKHQLVVGAQGVTGGGHLCGDDGRGQAAAAETGPCGWHRLDFAAQVGHVNA